MLSVGALGRSFQPMGWADDGGQSMTRFADFAPRPWPAPWDALEGPAAPLPFKLGRSANSDVWHRRQKFARTDAFYWLPACCPRSARYV